MSGFDKISISGKMGSGKSTVSDFFVQNYGYTVINSAKYLKRLCENIALRNLFALTSTKGTIIDRELDEILSFIAKDKEEKDILESEVAELQKQFSHVASTFNKTNDVREMLQEVARRVMDSTRKTIWVDSCIKDMKNYEKLMINTFVHDDLRYPHEYETLRNEGFVLVRLVVDQAEQEKRVKKLYGKIKEERYTHISEVALDGHEFDYVIDTSKPIEEVLKQIEEIITVSV